jgi:glycerol-3-phosphate dehydrogenase (NAD(P)+)
MTETLGILGGGAWGTALAQALARCGHKVLIWARERDTAAAINRQHENTQFLPGIPLSPLVSATSDIDDLPQRCHTLFVMSPSRTCTETAALLSPSLTARHKVILGSKGLRESDGALMSDVWMEMAPQLNRLAVLSGPSYARDVANDLPTALALASSDQALVDEVSALFTRPNIRLYYSDDMIGLQVGGALKNVIAIAAGVNDGLSLGQNLRAAILCRGVAEMARFGVALGGKPETFAGLAGLGDLILSATSPQSRNYQLGYRLAKGTPLQEAVAMETSVIEGIQTARLVTLQAVSRGIDLAIVMAVDGILNGDVSPARAMELLLHRPRVNEH